MEQLVLIWNTIQKLAQRLRKHRKFNSSNYWKDRYRAGGNSGCGSYHHLAKFKARILNEFVSAQNINSVIEFGCGDGNQLLEAKYKNYQGYDISKDAILICRNTFSADETKRFSNLDEYDGKTADLALSLDVIFHLIEDAIFAEYMTRLFGAARQYVIIYSSNTDNNLSNKASHVRHRKFTQWVSENLPDWNLIKTIPNEHPYNGDYKSTSFSDFFFYEKQGH
jgi:SAM-dependent methyltransferase